MRQRRRTALTAEDLPFESPLFWPAFCDRRGMKVLDETLLPDRKVWIRVRSVDEAVDVIRSMRTRAFGQFLVVMQTFWLECRRKESGQEDFLARIQAAARALNASRPTFPFAEVTGMIVNWGQKAVWGSEDPRSVLQSQIEGFLKGIRARRLDRVRRVEKILRQGDSVLTHCNVSGELAMACALAMEKGKGVEVFATETRPYFQGTRLTVWEMQQAGVPVTLIADNAVGSVMADGLVNKVIVGSDRNCANGDFANKVGTYTLAVLAEEWGLPFYVLTQPSTTLAHGGEIPVEYRPAEELLCFQGRRLFPRSVGGFYPGFDVVSHTWVTAPIPIEVGE